MIPVVYLALASLALLRMHVSQLPPESRPSLRSPLQPWSGRGPAAPAERPASPARAVDVVEAVEVVEVAPTPTKRTAQRPTAKKATANKATAKKATANKAPPAKK
jgi:hypothetical protein